MVIQSDRIIIIYKKEKVILIRFSNLSHCATITYILFLTSLVQYSGLGSYRTLQSQYMTQGSILLKYQVLIKFTVSKWISSILL